MKYLYTVVMATIVTICIYIFIGDELVVGLPVYIYTLLPYGEWFMWLLAGGYYVSLLILIFFIMDRKYYYVYVIVIWLMFFGLNAIAAQYINIGVSIFDMNLNISSPRRAD